MEEDAITRCKFTDKIAISARRTYILKQLLLPGEFDQLLLIPWNLICRQSQTIKYIPEESSRHSQSKRQANKHQGHTGILQESYQTEGGKTADSMP